MLQNVLIVGLGGFFGSASRYLLHVGMLKAGLDRFPLATLSANVLGCLIFGIVLGMSIKSDSKIQHGLLIFLTTGFCGGFTTFSTFAIENLRMIERDEILGMVIYTALSIVLGLLAGYGGLTLVRS
ncbi:MAG: fluoride efflux transporter CrcB [Bacteroidota bacterium]